MIQRLDCGVCIERKKILVFFRVNFDAFRNSNILFTFQCRLLCVLDFRILFSVCRMQIAQEKVVFKEKGFYISFGVFRCHPNWFIHHKMPTQKPNSYYKDKDETKTKKTSQTQISKN